MEKKTAAKESVKIHNPKEIHMDKHVHNSFGLVKCERKKKIIIKRSSKKSWEFLPQQDVRVEPLPLDSLQPTWQF